MLEGCLVGIAIEEAEVGSENKMEEMDWEFVRERFGVCDGGKRRVLYRELWSVGLDRWA
jgi:hypothetical protein